jgi:hypothetical protein
LPVVREAGWWRSPRRLSFPAYSVTPSVEAQPRLASAGSIRLEGAPSQEFLAECRQRGLRVVTGDKGGPAWLTLSEAAAWPCGRALDLTLDEALACVGNRTYETEKSA